MKSNDRQRVQRRLNLILSVVPLLVALIAVWGIHGIREQRRQNLRSELVSLLKITQGALHIWERDTLATVSFWAEFPETRSAALELLKRPRRPQALRDSAAFGHLRRLLKPVTRREGYIGFFLLAADGTRIAGDRFDGLGRNALSELGFATNDLGTLRARPAIGLPFHTIENGLPTAVMVATAPVRDSRGNVIAVLGFYLDPETELQTTKLARTGSTGEIYAFDRQGRLLTQSRFEDTLHALGWIGLSEKGPLSIVLRDPGGNVLEGYHSELPRVRLPLTRMAKSATAGESGSDLDGYRDYRGVQVVGAWLWDNDLGIGLASEIDLFEAYRSYYIMRRLVLFMLALTVGGAIVVLGLLLRQSSELMEAVQARTEFISVASHELKTPLTSLRMQLDLINRMASDGSLASFPAEKLVRMSRISSLEIGRLSRLVYNLLDVSRILSGKFPLSPEELDLRDLASSVIERMSTQLAAAGCRVALKSASPVEGRWDRYKLEQVMINLLSNALKYGRGTPIEIEVDARGGRAVLKVRDHGPGIKPEDHERIFERFERADIGRPGTGLGLGLYIVRNIVREHGGTIRVESSPGQGATFTVELPLGAVQPPKGEWPSGIAQSGL